MWSLFPLQKAELNRTHLCRIALVGVQFGVEDEGDDVSRQAERHPSQERLQQEERSLGQGPERAGRWRWRHVFPFARVGRPNLPQAWEEERARASARRGAESPEINQSINHHWLYHHYHYMYYCMHLFTLSPLHSSLPPILLLLPFLPQIAAAVVAAVVVALLLGVVAVASSLAALTDS